MAKRPPKKERTCRRSSSPTPSTTSTAGYRESRSAPTPSDRAAANVQDYVSQDGSSNIAITADVDDPASLEAMVKSPTAEVVAVMESHGVVQPISVYVEA